MTIAMTNQTRPNLPEEGAGGIIPPDASKANEPTFYRSDTLLALNVTPCPTTTYGDSPSELPPPRKKRFCETNLTLGGIDKMGKLSGAHAPTLITTVPNLPRGYSGRLSRRLPAAYLLPVGDHRLQYAVTHSARGPIGLERIAGELGGVCPSRRLTWRLGAGLRGIVRRLDAPLARKEVVPSLPREAVICRRPVGDVPVAV